MSLKTYWWAPRHDRRALMSEVRHRKIAWARMTAAGGVPFCNFGDELSRLAVAEVTGRGVRWSKIDEASLFGIGSILELYFNRGGTGMVWGSGLRVPQDFSGEVIPENFLAVRGHLTKDALGLGDECVLGDPGLVAKSLFSSGRGRRSGVLVVPHFGVYGSGAGYQLVKSFKSQFMSVLPPSTEVSELCRAIGSAEHLITSSLHGLVVGHALGTPTSLVSFGSTTEPDHKYSDYMSVYGRSASVHEVRLALDKSGLAEMRSQAEDCQDDIDGHIDGIVDSLFRAASQFRS